MLELLPQRKTALELTRDPIHRDKISPGRTIFPKGYVTMLERQQKQLMAGIQVLYRKYKQSNLWDGMELPEHENQPRIHDMLAHLGVLQQSPPDDSQPVEFQEFGLYSSADSSSAESPAGNATRDVHKVALTPPNTTRDSASPPCSAEYSPSDSCPVSFDDELAELLSPSDALSQAHTGQSCAIMVAQLNPHHVPIDYLASSSLDQLVWTGEEFANCPTTLPASPTGLPTHFGAFNTWVDANLC